MNPSTKKQLPNANGEYERMEKEHHMPPNCQSHPRQRKAVEMFQSDGDNRVLTTKCTA